MSQAVSPSSGKPYGTARVCHIWRLSRATLYRHRRLPVSEPPRRRGPIGPMADTGLIATIRTVLADTPFDGEGTARSGPGCACVACAHLCAVCCG